MVAERKRIVILGAVFAGLYAALEHERTVARDSAIEVLLIDPQNFLHFTPMLHEVASGSLDSSSIVVPIREACGLVIETTRPRASRHVAPAER